MKIALLPLLSATLLFVNVTCAADLSDYFLRDPYSQLDLFRQQSSSQRNTKYKKQSLNNEEGAAKKYDKKAAKLEDDYFDYLYEIGALEEEARMKKAEKQLRYQQQKEVPTVNADVLADVKKPLASRSKYTFRHKDKLESGKKKATMPLEKPKKFDSEALPGLENVKRLIPSSLQTVIEKSGKRIVKAVMEPIDDLGHEDRGTVIQESSFMNGMFDRYRTYIGYMAPTLAPEHVTSYLLAQWISTVAITLAWVSVGTLYSSMARSDDEGRSSPEPWEDLVPDSNTISLVLRDLSDVASRWHDEL